MAMGLGVASQSTTGLMEELVQTALIVSKKALQSLECFKQTVEAP